MKDTKSVMINAVGVKDAFAGIGNCVLYLFNEVALASPNLKFKVFVADRMKDRYKYTAQNIEVVPVRLPYNSLFARIIWDQFVCPFYAFRSNLLISMMNAACVLSPVRQITFIYDLADVHMPERFSKLKILYLRMFRFFTMRRSVCVVTISEATKGDLVSLYENFSSLFKVIPLGYKKMSSDQRTIDVLKKCNLSDYLLFVSTIEPGKNLPRLIKAFKIFSKNHSSFKLVIVGAKGWGYSEVECTIKNEGLEDSVLCLGYVSEEELHTLYASASGFVFPSLYEGFGLPVLEAMQYFVPILTSNVSSLPEVGGKGVVYCEPKNLDDIYTNIEKLITKQKKDYEPFYREQLEKFTWYNGGCALQRIIFDNLNKVSL
ncbi:MAG: glycosyltransferase family 4 protein [Fibrobacteres bacterium]|nr:glycosyltransferase family 4 protein [Fibrobacterota bacterium]